MKIRYVIALAALVPLAAVAEKATNEGLFKSLDKDRNGMITKAEAAKDKNLIAEWSKIDTDGNGTIEASELAAYKPAKAFEPVESENEPIGAAPTR